MKKLLFTDLDGTLLELETYSPQSSSYYVNKLREANISIIFCSSKTWSEQQSYLELLQLEEPVIVENGSSIFFPESFAIESLSKTYKIKKVHNRNALILGKSYTEVSTTIEEESKKLSLDLKHYANQSIDEISSITGLSMESSAKAKLRDFSETLFSLDQKTDTYKTISQALKSRGLQCIPGSRFITVTGIESNKGNAVRILIEVYRTMYDEVISYGVGDSQNDLEMLKTVNFPYLVQRPDQTWAGITADNITKIAGIGPNGWNIMAREILGE